MERLLSPELEHKIKTLPKEPGVYIMRDQTGVVIYVGKAVNLMNRVRQYFTSSAGKAPKVAAMVAHVQDFEYIITDSEMEALILECNLIKQYQPYYNILLRDDKQYPYVRLNLKEDFPRIEIVRQIKRDGAKYFGPYLAAHSIREVLDAVYKLFPLRSCKKDLSKIKKGERPCLNYQMGRCYAPCAGKVSREEYHEVVKEVVDLLSGKYKKIEKILTEEMYQASEKLDFEKAALLRDKIAVLHRVAERQKAGFPDLNDKDLFAAAIGESEAVVQAFFVRKGKLQEAERFFLSNGATDEAEALDSFLKQYYLDKTHIPKKIYLGAELEDVEILSQWLSGLRGSQVELIAPKRGDNKKLVDMARKNAAEALVRKEQRRKKEFERTVGAAEALGTVLDIGYVRRMECYDISNTQGTDSVASMVVFIDGKPAKKEYRRFRIKTVEGANDFASMEEVLTRRLTEGFHADDREHGFGAMPDLIVVDGGKGQLSSAVGVLESLGLEDLPIIGLAKREEEVFLPGESQPLVLPRTSPALQLLTAIRDEAHRFAITYHRNLRQARTISSELDRIPGVGPKRKKILLEAFESVDAIRRASIDQLAAVKGVDIATARAIYRYFADE